MYLDSPAAGVNVSFRVLGKCSVVVLCYFVAMVHCYFIFYSCLDSLREQHLCMLTTHTSSREVSGTTCLVGQCSMPE
jgi:ABC-type protease/lipase transport system fused ATPase/permease subunit